MNLKNKRHLKHPSGGACELEVLQVVLQLLVMLLPAVAYWSWRAARLDEAAQATALGLITVLITLGVVALLIFQRRGLAARWAIGLLGLGLLTWAVAVAVCGGGAKLELLLPFMAVVTAAVLGGLAAASRALADTRLALSEAEKQAIRPSESDQLESLFSKAFELSPLSMSLSRVSDGVFLALNAASQQIQGYKPTELLGRSALDLGTWQDAAERLAFLEQVRQHHGRFETERRVRRKDGSWVDCRVWATLVDVNGEACLLSAALDITQQKQRESQLLDLAQGLASPVGEPFLRSAARYLSKALNADEVTMTELGPDGRLATLAIWKDQAHVANTSFDAGLAPYGAVMASTDLVNLHSDEGMDCPALRFHDAQEAAVAPDRYRSCTGMCLRDADGTPIGALCASWYGTTAMTLEQSSVFRIVASRCTAELIRMRRDREIFRLKESLEHRVQARTEQLRATNAELESFAYSVSHDLQSPLRSIQGFLFLIDRRLKPRLSGEENRLMERINANVLRMHELINDLLALARVSRGHLVRESVDLSAIAENVIADLEVASPDRQVRVKIAPGLHASCDAKLARIVLENILGNAWKYTSKVPVAHIELGAAPAKPDGSPTFFVRDNGAGFDMNYAGSLFKPFHRLHHEDEYEGSGIGLATVHRILERHGGSIRAEAVEGRGACFYFAFEDGLSTAET